MSGNGTITPPGSSCDAAGLISVEEAASRGLSLGRPVGNTEPAALEDAVGRVLGEDLVAPFPLPPFDNSAMDGYALRSADLTGSGPWHLKVTGRVAAGDDVSNGPRVGPGETARIFTGAAIPAGADAVVMQEHVCRKGDVIDLDAPVSAGSCIRRAGEDAAKGAVLVPRGSLIGTREIGAIASTGRPQVRVCRKLRVAFLCTGSELVQPGQPVAPGQIYNSNRFMLIAALRLPWVDLIDLGAIGDEPDRLRKTLCEVAPKVDMIVTTGGVSVGEEDHMVAQLQGAGGRIEVMKIAMKPGKPLSLGMLNGAVFVGLPGNPVAAFTAWKIIGSRIAERLAGMQGAAGPALQAEAAGSFSRRPGRKEFRPARIVGISPDGRPRLEMLDKSFSGKIAMICKSDGFAVIPAESTRINAGDRLDFVPL